MILRKIKITIAFALIVEVVALSFWIYRYQQREREAYEYCNRAEGIMHAAELARIKEDFPKREFRATGRTPLDRVYNAKHDSIEELLESLTLEVLPAGWTCSVEIDEFIKFLLVLGAPSDVGQQELQAIARAIVPVLRHVNEYVFAVGVFDFRHVCRFFLDRPLLETLEREPKLSEGVVSKAGSLARRMKFSARRIPLRREGGHFYLPAVVYGSRGERECEMLLDSGACISVLPTEIVSLTGYDDLSRAARETFHTANGVATLPIVERVLVIGGLKRKLKVGVGHGIGLLGVDFFDQCGYTLEADEGVLYVWER